MIGTKLKELRNKKGVTIIQLCNELQMNQNTYAKYEREERDVSTETLAKFADFYGVTTDYLLGRSNEKPEPLAQLASEFNMSALEEKILKNYLALDEKMRGDLTDFLQKAVMEVKAESIQHSQIDAVPEKAIARSSDGDFKPAPTDEQFESFSVPADSDIDG